MSRNTLGRVGVLLAVLCSLAAAGPGTTRCGGSEGPKPLVDVSHLFKSKVSRVPTAHGIKDFQIWEKSNALVYRTTQNEIYSRKFGGADYYNFNNSNSPLSRVQDAGERYLLAEEGPWFLDTDHPHAWIHFEGTPESIRHLFWQRDKLYSMSDLYFTSSGAQSLEVFRYTAGSSKAVPVCSPFLFDPDDEVHVAKGHSWPYVHLYSSRLKAGGHELTLFRLNLRSCRFELKGTYKHLFPGPIREVNVFARSDSYLVTVDHPEMNAMWDPGTPGEGCRFIHLENPAEVMVNHHNPIIASWAGEKGLQIVYLDREDENGKVPSAYILGESMVSSLKPEDMWLTANEASLYLSPRFHQGRVLLKVALPDKLFLP